MLRRLAGIRTSLAAAASALADPGIRRVQAAWMLGIGADGALTVAMAVTIFASAGAGGVALLGAARLVPATVAGLFAAVPLGRWRPDRILLGVALARGASGLALLAILALGLPPESLFAVAALLGVAAAIARPVHSTALPALARSPGELIAANVASSTGEAIGTFGGPLGAAVAAAAGLAWLPGVAAAVAMTVAVWALLGIRYESVHDAAGPLEHEPPLALLRVGIHALRHHPAVGLTVIGFTFQSMTRGLMSTLIVVASLHLLGLGEPGVGLLNAALGVGGAFGLLAGLALGRSTPTAFVVALVGWGAPLAVIGLLATPATAYVALAVVGLSNALLDIVGFTLLQRGSANHQRGAVFAILEGSVGFGAVIGTLLAPLLLGAFDVRGALVASGLLLPTVAAVLTVLFRRLGHAELVPASAIAQLQQVPAFRTLPLTAIERIAHAMSRHRFEAGAVLMRKGESGDTFFLIHSGTVEVDDGSVVLDTLGPGAGIGEIALLRDGIRTATVVALEPVEAEAIDGGTFRAAVAGPAASAAAEQLTKARLARSAAVGREEAEELLG